MRLLLTLYLTRQLLMSFALYSVFLLALHFLMLLFITATLLYGSLDIVIYHGAAYIICIVLCGSFVVIVLCNIAAYNTLLCGKENWKLWPNYCAHHSSPDWLAGVLTSSDWAQWHTTNCLLSILVKNLYWYLEHWFRPWQWQLEVVIPWKCSGATMNCCFKGVHRRKHVNKCR